MLSSNQVTKAVPPCPLPFPGMLPHKGSECCAQPCIQQGAGNTPHRISSGCVQKQTVWWTRLGLQRDPEKPPQNVRTTSRTGFHSARSRGLEGLTVPWEGSIQGSSAVAVAAQGVAPPAEWADCVVTVTGIRGGTMGLVARSLTRMAPNCGSQGRVKSSSGHSVLSATGWAHPPAQTETAEGVVAKQTNSPASQGRRSRPRSAAAA